MLTNFRPYLIKALYSWLLDNGCTIHIRVNTEYAELDVPKENIDEHGYITLNVSFNAIGYMEMREDNHEYLETSIRFNGEETHLVIYYNAIDAIYDAATGNGNVFERVEGKKRDINISKTSSPEETISKAKENSPDEDKKAKRRSNLRLVD